MSRRSRILFFGAAALLVVAGGVAVAIFSGTVGQVLALALISLGLVLATGLVFLEVGLSEDRERAHAEREQAQIEARANAEPSSSQTDEMHSTRHMRPRLKRMRGSRRRLGDGPRPG